MIDPSRLIYLDGLESDSNSGKARLFREWFLQFFKDLTYHIVEDDHRLVKSVHELDWKNILG